MKQPDIIKQIKAWQSFSPLKLYKEKHGLTNAELGIILGVSIVSVSNFLSGSSRMSSEKIAILEANGIKGFRKAYYAWLKNKPGVARISPIKGGRPNNGMDA